MGFGELGESLQLKTQKRPVYRSQMNYFRYTKMIGILTLIDSVIKKKYKIPS